MLSARRAAAHELNVPRVLIVDDEMGVRESLRAILQGDYDVLTAEQRRGGARASSGASRSTS